LPRDRIEEQLGRPLADDADDADEDGTPSAPGQLRSHYAPAATLRLAVSAVRPGEALLAFGPRSPTGAETAGVVINLSPTGDLREAAARLFAALRELDAQAEAIAVAPIPQSGLGEAINDRLRRAAAPRS
jgi:L-threonylcarbamoyladenylate synthase